MMIRWLGHASFLIEGESTRIITDPFDDKLGYRMFNETVDIATVSHQHWDHNAVESLQGHPTVIATLGTHHIKETRIQGFASFHDQAQGQLRGPNIIFKISLEGIDIVHLGDLGHILDGEMVDAIGNVDVLLIPVGGIYTINADEARQVAAQLKPTIIVPMHYQTRSLSFELEPLEGFTGQYDSTVKQPFLKVGAQTLQEQAGVVVLDYPGS